MCYYQQHACLCTPPLPPPLFCSGVGGKLSLQPNLKKGGLDRTSTFRGGLLGKRGVNFLRGGCNCHIID